MNNETWEPSFIRLRAIDNEVFLRTQELQGIESTNSGWNSKEANGLRQELKDLYQQSAFIKKQISGGEEQNVNILTEVTTNEIQKGKRARQEKGIII